MNLAGMRRLQMRRRGAPGESFDPDEDLITRQTLGADAQELTIPVVAADGIVEWVGKGPLSTAGAHNFTFLWNGAATNVTIQTNSQLNGGSFANNDATRLFSFTVTEFLNFWLRINVSSGAVRGGFGLGWSGTATPRNNLHICSTTFNDASAVTSITLRSSRVDGFKSGFEYEAFRGPLTS